jgi:oligopeptide transport system substrate-binding protein
MRLVNSLSRFKPRLALLVVAGWLLSCGLIDVLVQQTAVTDIPRDDAIFLVGGQPETMDPALTRGGPDSPLGHIFSGLTTLDTALQVQPELAAGWTVSDDGLVYTFYLRRQTVFHNGRPLTAHDVIFAWERATDPATGSDTAQTYLGDIAGVPAKLAGEADHISGLRALDDYTLEVTLASPVVYFLAKLAYPVAYVVDRDNVALADWQYQPNGSGPFKLNRWQDDEVIVLERFDGYYLEPAQVAYVVYDLGPVLPLAQYETDDIDLVGIGGPTLERARDPNSPFSQELRTAVTLCTSTIGLNNRLAPFDDPLVRQAFNYALDKDLLIETFDNGNALPALGPLPPGMPGYGLSGVGGYPFDPDRARALLAEAGYANMDDFPPLTYYSAGYGDVGGYVTAVITLWQEQLGVTIEPVVLDPFTYYDELYAGNVGHIFNSGWCADYPDPQNFLDVLYHSQSQQNLGGFSDPALDALLEAARIEPDVNQRLALYADSERQIVAAAPVVFTTHDLSAVLVKPGVQNYVLTPLGVRQWHQVVKK